MSEVKLLPLPEPEIEERGTGMGAHDVYYVPSLYTPEQMESYARANMEPLIAENERLRAKYQRAAESSEHFAARAERLAEALRKIANQGPNYGPDGTRETWRHWSEIARAALDQEGGNG